MINWMKVLRKEAVVYAMEQGLSYGNKVGNVKLVKSNGYYTLVKPTNSKTRTPITKAMPANEMGYWLRWGEEY